MAHAWTARCWLVVLVAGQLVHGLTTAWAGDKPKPPDPADPSASVPSAAYESALGDFRRLELKPLPWKRANDTVRSVGGHMGSVEDREKGDDAAAHAGHKAK